MSFVKFDMHTHTHEGSPDSKVKIREYIDILIKKGFGGMVVTDHNSYDGYNDLKDYELRSLSSFAIIKGIEYDTSDFGHMLIIMPKGKIPDILLSRGMRLSETIRVVHESGGIIGPAHPCGEPFLSFFTTGFSPKKQLIKSEYLNMFDFIEGYNACEEDKDNYYSRRLAKMYNLPMTGGSDAHWHDCVGLGYALIPRSVKDEDDLISYIKTRPDVKVGGHQYGKTTKDKLGFFNHFLVYGFFYYNKFETIIKTPLRILNKKRWSSNDEKY